MKRTIDKQLFFFLTLAFMAVTVIGTLTHECGHYIAAKLMGFDARISYNMTITRPAGNTTEISNRQSFWITLGGPLQTLLTGILGFWLLYNETRSTSRFTVRHWILVFLTLFWLRPLANFIVWTGSYFITGQPGKNGDEINLARHLNWPDWSIISVTAFSGAVVLAVVLFRFIPGPYRFTFALSGLAGGASGYMLWFGYLGKLMLP